MAKLKSQDQLTITSGNRFLIPGPEDLAEQESSGVPYADLCDPRSRYSPQKKMEVVTAYYIWGDSITASDKTGVNANTIRWWKSEASWWPALEAKIRKEKNDELIGGYTRALGSYMTHVEDALKGDPIIDKKSGEIVGYKKPSLRDIVMAMAIMQDKRAQLLGEPTTASHKSTSDQLAEVFKKFLEDSEAQRKKRETTSYKVIEAERIG